jgi:hypothetical protein
MIDRFARCWPAQRELYTRGPTDESFQNGESGITYNRSDSLSVPMSGWSHVRFAAQSDRIADIVQR